MTLNDGLVLCYNHRRSGSFNMFNSAFFNYQPRLEKMNCDSMLKYNTFHDIVHEVIVNIVVFANTFLMISFR